MLDRIRGFFQHSLRPFYRRRWRDRITETHLRWLRAIIALAGIGMIVWLFPRESTTEFSGWREGMVAPREVIAPFSFNVRTNEVELEQRRARARVSVMPVVRAMPEAAVEQEDRLMDFLQLADDAATGRSAALPDTALPLPREHLHASTLSWLSDRNHVVLARRIAPAVLRNVFQQGVLSVEDETHIRNYFARRANILSEETLPEQVAYINPDNEENPVLISRFQSTDEVRDTLGERIPRHALSVGVQLSPDDLRALHNLISSVITANRYYDRNETITRQAQAAGNVPLFKRTIFKDERFIESHAVLTSDDIDELRSLMEAQQQRRRQQTRWQEWTGWFARGAIVAAIVFIIGAYIREFHREVWRRPDWLFLCLLLIWLPLTTASYVATSATVSVYMIPMPLTAMLATVLFGPQIAFVLAAAGLLIAGVLLGFDFQMVFVNALASAVAVFSVRNVRNRNQFLRAMIYLPLSIVTAIAAIDALQGTTLSAMWNHIWPGAVNGLAVPVLSMGLLVVFERLFGITTNITLLELSDLNSPALRELAIRAPGTYTHSIIIANLAESAAEAINANPLLARVGSYYHDLGKMKRPDHFIENQLYKSNPHDKLSPHMSALVVTSHVKDGIETAERIGLPQQIVDFIPEHHGTMLMTYFYRKAQQMYGEDNVSEEEFRHSGPKPQSKETAILMMADAVEAAVRSLKERTPARVQGLVKGLIHERLDDGQFDECDLTLRDLDRIAASFMPVLSGAMHERIEYPEDRTTPTQPQDGTEEQEGAQNDDIAVEELTVATDKRSDSEEYFDRSE